MVKKLLPIVLLAFVLRLALFLAMQPCEPETYDRMPDAEDFLILSENLHEYRAFSHYETPPLIPHIRRTPVFPLFAAGIYSIVGVRPEAVLLAQVAISALLCLVTYALGSLLFDERVGLLAALLHACEYSTIIYANNFTADIFLAAFVSLHLCALLLFLKSGKYRFLVAAAIFLAFSALTKAITIYFAVFLLPVFWLHRERQFLPALKSSSVFLAVFLLVIAPWIARNYVTHGRLIVSSQQDHVVTWHLPSVVPHKSTRLREAGQETSPAGEPVDRSMASGDTPKLPSRQIDLYRLGADAWQYIKGVPRYFFVVGSSSVPRALGLKYETVRSSIVRREGIVAAAKEVFARKTALEKALFVIFLSFLVALNLTALYAICVELMARRHVLQICALLVVLLYFALAVGSVAKSERYRVPIIPVLVVLSSHGLLQIREKRKRNRTLEHCLP